MDTGTIIAIYLPALILLFVIIPMQFNEQVLTLRRNKKSRRRNRILEYELLKRFIGKNCKISTGTYGSTISGKISDVKDNWIEVETKKGTEIINADFVFTIKLVD